MFYNLVLKSVFQKKEKEKRKHSLRSEVSCCVCNGRSLGPGLEAGPSRVALHVDRRSWSLLVVLWLLVFSGAVLPQFSICCWS